MAWMVLGGLAGLVMLTAGSWILIGNRAYPTPTSTTSPQSVPTNNATLGERPFMPAVAASLSPTLEATNGPFDGSSTPVPRQSPTSIPSPTTWYRCADARQTRLEVGDKAYVSFEPPLSNRVRESPGTSAAILGHIRPGEEVKVVEGPECTNGWVWWRVTSLETGLSGWTAEGDEADYWLVPSP